MQMHTELLNKSTVIDPKSNTSAKFTLVLLERHHKMFKTEMAVINQKIKLLVNTPFRNVIGFYANFRSCSDAIGFRKARKIFRSCVLLTFGKVTNFVKRWKMVLNRNGQIDCCHFKGFTFSIYNRVSVKVEIDMFFSLC